MADNVTSGGFLEKLKNFFSFKTTPADTHVRMPVQQDLTTNGQLQRPQNETPVSKARRAILWARPDAYENMHDVRPATDNNGDLVIDHHSRGTALVQNGTNILEFDVAGSGFKSFRSEHKGLKGKGSWFNPATGKTEKIGKQAKVSWYNRYLSWMPGIRSAEQIEEDNQQFLNSPGYKALIEKFGESTEVNGKVMEHIRKKETGGKLRYSLAGPLMFGGVLNGGEYSIENLREYIFSLGKNYLLGKFDQYAAAPDSLKPIQIIIRGHSRGAVAASEGAMMLKHWIQEAFPEKFRSVIQFELVQYDPVPGPNAKGAHAKIDHDENFYSEDGDVKMSGLGKSANTTLVYSMHTEHNVGFTPQEVFGARRIILTTGGKHAVGLGDSDETGKHRRAYTDANGETYRSSGISELPDGVYVADENNQLIRINSYAQAARLLYAMTKDYWREGAMQAKRHQVVLNVVKAWFDSHPDQ